MFANLGATTEREIYHVNTVGVNDGENLGTVLGIRTRIFWVVTKLKEVAGLSKR